MRSTRFVTQCSVSGRGIKTGGRARRLSGPKGWEPGKDCKNGGVVAGRRLATQNVLKGFAKGSPSEHVRQGEMWMLFHPFELQFRLVGTELLKEFCTKS